YLEDEGLEIGGLKFWGTPWLPNYLSMAFNMDRGGDALHEKRLLIPDDTNVLITHCPPMEILDWINGAGALGCNQLRWRVDNLPDLKLHCFGHIHARYGVEERDGRIFVNAALVNDWDNGYVKGRKPIVIDL
ncbi:MAG: metallophosphoesterase, partial [Cyanobacteria bacterium]|nr:metallophosphoesterase [Cyanobacteriota bacterium]